ncbi:DUF1559 domain-containing protein [Gimesia sp.]|uniref:DUF1559 family PulG-like putative transporter n=1 Tax=Gimesia sp. TaxID=2024833 RepID=UPI000C69504E|nr:DUF1559 domain-containing protein [Gimesia sp.]MAX36513.1 hypothetical protein [Gimesia sp.]HAH48721.1 hypothetical protein [Planctomycetaceae bacterium]HBL46568.1 hypothetical protein [Planctomycetaceae bacterium]|tara:strand:+ start:28524 stop:30191 length:1668 start_codon:yes stop_codon:yes gene_type:complete
MHFNTPHDWRTLSHCLVAALLLAVAIGERSAVAQDKSDRGPKDQTVLPAFPFDAVPDTAFGVIAVRPAQILSEKAMQPVRELTQQEKKQPQNFDLLGIDLTQLESIVLIYLPSDTGKQVNPLVRYVSVIRSNKVIDRQQARTKFSKLELKPVDYKDRQILTTGALDGDGLCFLDDKTLIASDHISAVMQIIDQLESTKGKSWSKQMQPWGQSSVAAAIDLQTTRKLAVGQQMHALAERIPFWPVLSPLWEHPDLASFSLKLDRELSVKMIFEQKENRDQVKHTLEGVLLLGQNLFAQIQETARKNPQRVQKDDLEKMKVIESALQAARVTQDANQVTLATSLNDDDSTQLLASLVPGIKQARAAARRSVSKNNIKQIMLALHNYHQVHKHFPPAVVLGPDGKTPHSWRVELLPFLDQKALYDSYKMNEPWDSEHNKKIAETLVPVYYNPNSENTANASYFVVVGKNTPFGTEEGVSFAEMTDGTSKIMAIVEAKRDVPWTKPEDISFDGKKLPEFGGFHDGGYQTGFCDGSVHFISSRIDPETLIGLLTINDGKP